MTFKEILDAALLIVGCSFLFLALFWSFVSFLTPELYSHKLWLSMLVGLLALALRNKIDIGKWYGN